MMESFIKSDFVEKVINSIEGLTGSMMFLITDMETGNAWMSDAVRGFLGETAENQNETQVFDRMVEMVHPYDRQEFTDGVSTRLNGENIGESFSVRMGSDGQSFMYTVLTDVVKDESANKYLVFVLRNDNMESEIDPQTDLFKGIKLGIDVDELIEAGGKATVIEVKIEHLNDLSILYGFDCRNRILKELATRFIYMMDENKSVYRIEGSRFAFLLKGYGRAESEGFVERVKKVLENDILLDGRQFALKAHFGGMWFSNYKGTSESVHSKVGYALDLARSRHATGIIFFNEVVQLDSTPDLELMKILYQSINNDCEGFYVEYQPIVRAEDGTIMGAEALVRWKKEPYGNVPPAVFIEWLEDNPVMYDLGNFVLKEALTAAKEFIAINPDFFINVNVSAKQLEREEFRYVVLALLGETGYPVSHLCLELTERCRNLPISLLSEEMQFMRDTGIRLAMDDYGTGAASSSIVLNVPMNEIKIDMSFIKGIEDNPKQQALVKNMISFAQQAGMATCLEGVEDEGLEQYLRDYGATWFQGYYYSRPVAKEKIIEMLKKA